MAKPATTYTPRRSGKKLFIAVPVGLGALFVAYAVGHWTADPPPAPAPQAEPPPARAEPALPLPPPPAQRAPEQRTTPPKAPAFGEAIDPTPQPSAPAPARVTPELLNRVTSDASAQIETYRPQFVSRCTPPGGLGEGAQVTFHVTFDAQGREIARGISENRRNRAGAFAKCMRELGGIEFSVPPPGTNVAVSVPMSF